MFSISGFQLPWWGVGAKDRVPGVRLRLHLASFPTCVSSVGLSDVDLCPFRTPKVRWTVKKESQAESHSPAFVHFCGHAGMRAKERCHPWAVIPQETSMWESDGKQVRPVTLESHRGRCCLLREGKEWWFQSQAPGPECTFLGNRAGCAMTAHTAVLGSPRPGKLCCRNCLHLASACLAHAVHTPALVWWCFSSYTWSPPLPQPTLVSHSSSVGLWGVWALVYV